MTAYRAVMIALIALAVAGLAVILTVFAREYQSAPGIVATHFGADGLPNHWGPKSTFTIFPILGAVLLVAIVIAANFPQTTGGVTMPWYLPLLAVLALVEALWLIAFTEVGTFDVALGRARGLGGGFFVMLTAVIVTALAAATASIVASLTSKEGGRTDRRTPPP